MKKRIVVTALLLCVAFVMASMAYTAATVTNAATLKVVSTSGALLALTPYDGLGNKDGTASVEKGQMVFNFNKGTCNKEFGLQPGSKYVWKPLFTVTNNISEKIKVTVTASGAIAPYLQFGYMDKTGNVITSLATEPNWGDKVEFFIDNSNSESTLQGCNPPSCNNGSVGVWVKVEVLNTYSNTIPKDFSGTITVEAEAVK